MRGNISKIRFIILVFILLPLFSTRAAEYSGELLLGYKGGLGFQANLITSDFARGFPLNLQLGLAYTSLDPGSATDARRIFINDATNGDPEKSGWMWDLRFDFLYRIRWFSLQNAFIYGGPRYSLFTANFAFIGGNEDFDITTNQWGLGLGLKAYFEMSNKFDFVTSAGFDYFFSNTLSGHDTEYSPDSEDVNGRNDYNYDDADNAINQPKLQLRLLVGINYHF